VSVTRAAFDKAVKEAKRTGLPQPVKDDKGKVAYFVDQQGQTVDSPDPGRFMPGSPRNTQPESSFGQSVAGGLKATQEQQSAQAAIEAKAKADAQARTAAAKAKAAQRQALIDQANSGGMVWVDGKLRKIVSIEDKNGTTLLTEELDGNKTQVALPTAFDLLDSQSIGDHANTPFLMTRGRTDVFNPTATSAMPGGAFPNYTPVRPGALNPASAGEYSQQANTTATGQNQLTIQNGLTWLANLSVKDPQAYAHMVDQLHDAGYLDDSHYAVSGGPYSSAVGDAFTQAALETAVLNSGGTEEGALTTLQDVLNKRATANKALQEKARAQAYTPIARHYTDPTQIVAEAQSAAQTALGRKLTDAEAQKIADHFHSLESSAYDSADAQGRQGGSYSITLPSDTGQVMAALNSPQYAQEQANYAVAQYGSGLRRLFGLDG
jgi:hypothetical protein